MPEYQRATKEIVTPVAKIPATIRETDAYAEELLIKDLSQFAKRLPEYWARLTVQLGDKKWPNRDDVLALRIPDLNSLIIEIYKLSFGDVLVITDPGEEGGYKVDLNELDFIVPPEGSGTDPTFSVTLPRTGHVVEYGFLTGDSEWGAGSSKSLAQRTFEAIRSVDGSQEIKLAEYMAWPGLDHRTLRAAMKRSIYGYDPRVRITR